MAPKRRSRSIVFRYDSGAAAATTPDYGDVVLAEDTLPFNEVDVSHYRSLYQRTVVALG